MIANGSSYEFRTTKPFNCSALEVKNGKVQEPEAEMIEEISTYFKSLVPDLELNVGMGKEKDSDQNTLVDPYKPFRMSLSDSIGACANWIQRKYEAFIGWTSSTWENWKPSYKIFILKL